MTAIPPISITVPQNPISTAYGAPVSLNQHVTTGSFAVGHGAKAFQTPAGILGTNNENGGNLMLIGSLAAMALAGFLMLKGRK